MQLKGPRNQEFHWSPNPIHQLGFGVLVCTVEPNIRHNQFKANTRLGIVLRNPTRSMMGWTVLRAELPFTVSQRLFLSYTHRMDLLPTTLADYLDFRQDRLPSEASTNPSVLAQTDHTAFMRRVFGTIDHSTQDGFVHFNSFGHVVKFQSQSIDDIDDPVASNPLTTSMTL